MANFHQLEPGLIRAGYLGQQDSYHVVRISHSRAKLSLNPAVLLGLPDQMRCGEVIVWSSEIEPCSEHAEHCGGTVHLRGERLFTYRVLLAAFQQQNELQQASEHT